MNKYILSAMKSSLKTNQQLLIEARVNNQAIESLRADLTEATQKKQEAEKHYIDIRNSIDICHREAAKFRDGRIAELEKRAEAVLELAFPAEKFGVKLKQERTYNSDKVTLLIGPRDVSESQWFSPTSENGGFVKQLIGASMIASICIMRKSSYIFLDEMFCSGDAVSVADISPFFKNILENDIQLLIIEHKPTLYERVARREFHLAKNREFGKNVKLLEQLDKTGEEEE